MADELDRDKIDADYFVLYQTIAETVEAAIRSDILNQHFRPIGDGEYYTDYANITLYADNSLYDADSGWLTDVAGWNPRTQRDHFAQEIGAVFENWDLLPDRAASQPALSAAQSATSSLALHTTAEASRKDDIPELESGSSTLGRNLELALGINGFKGAAMEALKQDFTSYLPGTIEGEYALLGVVGAALQAEQDVWVRARADIVEIAKAAKKGMEDANFFDGDMGGSGEVSAWWGVVGAVAGAAAAFFSGGTAVLLGGVSSAVGVLTSFDAVAEKDDKPDKFGAATPDEVLAKVKTAIGDLRASIAEAEQAIADGCADAVTKVAVARIGAYGLPPIRALGDTDSGDYISGEGEVAFNLESLEIIATDYLPDVADDLDDASKTIASACDSGAFARRCPFGENPWSDFKRIWEQLDNSVRDTSWKTRHVGTQLELFVKDFRATESHNADAMARIDARLEGAAKSNQAGSGYDVDTGSYYDSDGNVIPH